MSKLLRCPFCGGEPSLGKSLTADQSWLDHVERLECGAMAQSCNSINEAIKVWNTRFIDEKYQKLILILKDTVENGLFSTSTMAKSILNEIGEWE